MLINTTDRPVELSYVDLLTGLHNDVENDIIPESEKADILNLIYQLEEKLWKYSY